MAFFLRQVFEDINLHKKVVLKNVLSVMNYVFAVTFTLEMLLKIFGLGFVGYFSNLWNCLDCFIVAVCPFLWQYVVLHSWFFKMGGRYGATPFYSEEIF